MGARRIRREQRRADMAESRSRNGPLKTKERARREARLLDALKPDTGSGRRSGGEGGSGGGGGGGGAGGSGGAGDGIAALAQLKALRVLQEEINERTRLFDKEHPDREKLTKKDADDLQILRQEQGEVAELFQQLTAPTESQGDKK